MSTVPKEASSWSPPTPVDEARLAIVAARQRLESAITTLAGGDENSVGQAYATTAQCADDVARALWFLRRAEREGETLLIRRG
ncbi:MAG TPA: hypothetical protein VHS99_06450 [Chloroflexota bacterium]|jgi:hypothetical protein|nr:hypothetical protein [Chloroflexota bacterium]